MTDSIRKSIVRILSSVILAVLFTSVACDEARSTAQYKNTLEGDDLWSGIKMPEISYFAGESARREPIFYASTLFSLVCFGQSCPILKRVRVIHQ
jgi:hypothetical protein